jgi:hypothetical protein
MHATSQYGICFEAILLGMVLKLLDHQRDNPRLSVVVEDGHKNAGDTARIFEEWKQEWRSVGRDIFRTHSLASKEDSHPLMAVDLNAYGSARRERAIKAGTFTSRIDMNAALARKNDLAHQIIKITPRYLEKKIATFNERKAQAHADFLSRKAAFAASLKEQSS